MCKTRKTFILLAWLLHSLSSSIKPPHPQNKLFIPSCTIYYFLSIMIEKTNMNSVHNCNIIWLQIILYPSLLKEGGHNATNMVHACSHFWSEKKYVCAVFDLSFLLPTPDVQRPPRILSPPKPSKEEKVVPKAPSITLQIKTQHPNN